MPGKWVYQLSEGNSKLRALLGNKGANLCELYSLEGVSIPPGFIVTTEAWRAFRDNGSKLPEGVRETISDALAKMEAALEGRLGDEREPLLVSVRSGAPVSMPGMMDTILNIGMTPGLIQTIERKYRLPSGQGQLLLTRLAATLLVDPSGSILSNPYEQLFAAINLVMASWFSERAVAYRRSHGIGDDIGTAVIIQRMVLGLGRRSGTGVVFSRNPKTGERAITGEFLENALGEDLVAGKRKPLPIEDLKRVDARAFDELRKLATRIEKHFHSVQEIEFTVSQGRLWVLQTRNAILSQFAAARAAVEMVADGLLTSAEAVSRIDIGQLDNLVHYSALSEEEKSTSRFLGRGLTPSFGAASGRVALSHSKVKAFVDSNQPCIFVMEEADPELFRAMLDADGVLTQKGGETSHIALVARGLNKACVVGCSSLRVDQQSQEITISGFKLREGEYISLDANTGEVYAGRIRIVRNSPVEREALFKLREWAAEFSAPSTWASADYRRDVRRARAIAKQLQDLWSNTPYLSIKAKTAIVHSRIPEKDRIVQIPVDAFKPDLISQKMSEVIRQGNWVGIRTGLLPQPLGNSPWRMGIKTASNIDEFLRDVYPQWIHDRQWKDLTEIIVVSNPPELGERKFDHKHFVFRVWCLGGQVVIELRLGTSQLRSIEKNADPRDLIRIWANVEIISNDIQHGKYFPEWRCAFGAAYLKTDSLTLLQQISREQGSNTNRNESRDYSEQLCVVVDTVRQQYRIDIREIDMALLGDLCTQLMNAEKFPVELVDLMVMPKAYKVAQATAHKVFREWWDPDGLDLPYLMWGYDIAHKLHILEAQGRMDEEGNVEYILIYDIRGREEQMEASKIKDNLGVR